MILFSDKLIIRLIDGDDDDDQYAASATIQNKQNNQLQCYDYHIIIIIDNITIICIISMAIQ